MRNLWLAAFALLVVSVYHLLLDILHSCSVSQWPAIGLAGVMAIVAGYTVLRLISLFSKKSGAR